jgi:phenylalanyl-tRNA synthetase beta chain
VKIRLDVLSRFVALPLDPHACRTLLDEVGVEVKRFDAATGAATLELLANRGDHHAYLGIAREVRGRTGASLCTPPHTALRVGGSTHPVTLASPLVFAYTLTRLRGPANAALGADALTVLEAGGLVSKGAVIDATNVANLELGQPTHAFDASKVVGPIVVRAARAGERAWPLFFAEPVTLPPGVLVIADDVKVLAIAGVIGCEESKSGPETTEILLESGAFDPVAVRKAARALGINTDSSARFERGSDRAAVLVGAGRVATLLAEAGWQLVGDTVAAGELTAEDRVIAWQPADSRRFLGVDDADDALVDRLSRYGFCCTPRGAGRYDVHVPPWRLWDVSHRLDLDEELARSFGYDATPTALPPIDLGAVPSAEERSREAVEAVLVGAGFYEVFTDGFYARGLRERLGIDEGHPLYPHLETANALDRAYALLKNQAVGQAVELVATNLAVSNPEVKAFELTRLFLPDAAAEGGVREHAVLWAIASGSERPRSWAGAERPADAAFARGLVEQIAHRLGAGWTFAALPLDHALADLLHPGRRLGVFDGERCVGVLGEVHPATLAAFKIKRARPVFLQIDRDAIAAPGRRPSYIEPSRLQPVSRNLAFGVPHGLAIADVVTTLRDAGPAWLEAVDIVDRFILDTANEGSAVAWTLALRFENVEGGRSTEAVNGAVDAMAAAVLARWGEAGVSMRA